jgi:hypothetical protein
MNERRARFEYLANIKRYLAELSVLLGRPITSEELLGLDATGEILTRSKNTMREGHRVAEIPFSERTGASFAAYVAALQVANTSGVFLWTPRASACGLPRPIGLSALNWGFPFDIYTEGILSVIAVDMRDRLVIDFSREAEDREVLQIEAEGVGWARVELS